MNPPLRFSDAEPHGRAYESLCYGPVLVQEWPGLLDVLAVLGWAQPIVAWSLGVSGAATCSLGNGGAGKRDRQTRLTGCRKFECAAWTVEPRRGGKAWKVWNKLRQHGRSTLLSSRNAE
jgi:hypothetical protein